MALKRILKKLIVLSKDPPANCSARPLREGPVLLASHDHETCRNTPLRLLILFLDNSSYAGGVFVLDIHFPKNYPIKPSKINFMTRIYHPNINSNRSICLNSCKKDPDPNSDDPLVPETANISKTDKARYEAC